MKLLKNIEKSCFLLIKSFLHILLQYPKQWAPLEIAHF